MKKLLFIPLFSLFQFMNSFAQPGSLDLSFDPGTGFDELTFPNVFTSIIQSDGKIIVGGEFTTYNGNNANYILRLNENGSYDDSFNTNSDIKSNVFDIKLQSDGKVLIGGDFSESNGSQYNRIARLNSNGSIDLSFDIGSGFDSHVREVVLQDDGKILAGGGFSFFNGSNRDFICRLNQDGSLDNTFGTDTGFNSNVLSLALQPDGKIIAGGSFTEFDGNQCNLIARLNQNGNLDTAFNIGTGFQGEGYSVYCLALQPDGKILAGGSFSSYNGIVRNYIARINPDGSIDTSFDTGLGFNNAVNKIVIQNDGKLLIGGQFTEFSGIECNYMARLNSNGSLDTLFNTETGFNGSIFTMSIQINNKIIVGGRYSLFSQIGRNCISRLNNDPLSIETIELESPIRIWNSHNQIFIDMFDQNIQAATAIVYNLLGEVITSASFNSQTFQLQLPETPASVLLVRVTSNEFDVTKKVVVGVE